MSISPSQRVAYQTSILGSFLPHSSRTAHKTGCQRDFIMKLGSPRDADPSLVSMFGKDLDVLVFDVAGGTYCQS